MSGWISRGLVKCLADRPLLFIPVVLSSVPTEAWADPQRDGMCGSPLRGGADCGGRALLRMILVFAMWPYLKDDLSNDNKLNNETETI